MDKDLGQLFREARLYGRVRIFTLDSGCYNCSIEFNTISHVKLEACSGYNHLEPEPAVLSAINKAKEIISSMVEMNNKLIGDGNA